MQAGWMRDLTFLEFPYSGARLDLGEVLAKLHGSFLV